MKALTWHGTHDVRVDNVDDPTIQQDRDAIIKITATAICGSDLHLYNGLMAGMQEGDVLGHEFMGEVVETGSAVNNLKKGDRVVVPFTISCGSCFFCNKHLYSLCDESNPNADQAAELAERTLVQEVADAAAGIQLALAVMLGQALVTTHRTGMSPATGELAESFLPVPGPGHRYLLSSVATRPAALTILNCLL